MFTFDFLPADDELLYGYIGALYTRSGFINFDEFRKYLSPNGRFSTPMFAFHPPLLHGLAEYLDLDLSPQGISSLTLFPYYRPFLPDFCRRWFARQWKSQYNSSTNYMNLPARLRNEVKFCEDCLLDSQKMYGRDVWRRAHQLPGVLVCWKHEKPLYSYKASFSSYHPYAVDKRLREVLVEDVSEYWLMLARLSKEILDGAYRFYPEEVELEMYHYDSEPHDERNPILFNSHVRDYAEFWSYGHHDRWRKFWPGSTLEVLDKRYTLSEVLGTHWATESEKTMRAHNTEVYLLPLARILELCAKKSYLNEDVSVANHFQKCDEMDAYLWKEPPEDKMIIRISQEHFRFMQGVAEHVFKSTRRWPGYGNFVPTLQIHLFRFLLKIATRCSDESWDRREEAVRKNDCSFTFWFLEDEIDRVGRIQMRNGISCRHAIYMMLETARLNWDATSTEKFKMKMYERFDI